MRKNKLKKQRKRKKNRKTKRRKNRGKNRTKGNQRRNPCVRAALAILGLSAVCESTTHWRCRWAPSWSFGGIEA